MLRPKFVFIAKQDRILYIVCIIACIWVSKSCTAVPVSNVPDCYGADIKKSGSGHAKENQDFALF